MESRRGRTGIAKDIRTIVAASTTVYTYRLYIHTVTTGYSYSVYVSLYLFFWLWQINAKGAQWTPNAITKKQYHAIHKKIVQHAPS